MISKLRKRLLQDERPQYRVAADIGIHPSTISQYALGRIEIQPHHLVMLTRYYQCNPEDIMGYLDEPDILDWIEDAKEKV